MGNFYEVHCTNCGKLLQADQMAVDIDRILKTHLSKIREKNNSSMMMTAKKVFCEIRTGICLTKAELERHGLLAADGTLRLDCAYVLEHISQKYDADLKKISKKEAEERLSWEEEEDPFALEDPYEDDWDTDGGSSEEEYEIPQELLDRLCGRMMFYGQTDSREEEKKACIREMLQMLLAYQEEKLLECGFVPVFTCDDRGQEFMSACRVVYADGDVAAYNHMVCPDCGEEFFIDAGKYQEHIIVMLGSSRVGKTAYLAALTDILNPEYGQPRYPSLTVKDTPDRRYTYFKERILRQYRDGRKILKTDERREAAALFSLDVLVGEKTAIFTFVDLPGEVFVPRNEEEKQTGEASGRFIINHRKICYAADAFWFCIDPVQIDQRLLRLNEAAGADRVEQDINLVLSNIENVLQLMGREKADTPAAVIITKSDLPAEEAGIFFRSGEPEFLQGTDGFLNDRYKSIAAGVKQYLRSNNVKNILPKLEHMFTRKNYFAVAAYGRSVEEDEGIQKAPSGIILPFLWTLAVLGYLRPLEYVLTERKVHGGILKGRLGMLGGKADRKDSEGDMPGRYETVDRRELFT